MQSTRANDGGKLTGLRQGNGFGLRCGICPISALEECSSARVHAGKCTAYASHCEGGGRMTTQPMVTGQVVNLAAA